MRWSQSLLWLCVAVPQSTEGMYNLVQRRLPNHVNSFRFTLVDANATGNYHHSTVSSIPNGTILAPGRSLSTLSSDVVDGWSPASSGLILVPMNAGFGLGGLLVGWLAAYPQDPQLLCLVPRHFPFVRAGFLYPVNYRLPCCRVPGGHFFEQAFADSLANYTLSHVLHLTGPPVHYIVTSLVAISRGFAGSFGSAVRGGFFTMTNVHSNQDLWSSPSHRLFMMKTARD